MLNSFSSLPSSLAWWLLRRVSLVVIVTLIALILTSAVVPLVRWLVGKGGSRLLATGAAFLGIVLLLGGVVTGIVFAVRHEWQELSDQAIAGWQQLQRFAMECPLPIDTEAIDAGLQQARDFVTSGAFLAGPYRGSARPPLSPPARSSWSLSCSSS